MAKQKNIYVCRSCGAQSPKWLGRCNACGEWNSFDEEIVTKADDNKIIYGIICQNVVVFR